MTVAAEPQSDAGPQADVVLIVNPTAGRGEAGRQVPEIKRRLGAAGATWTWRFTEKSGDALTLAREAVAAGARLVVAVGGDGTLHEVMNGVLGSGAAVGLIPYGTGNDFGRALGLHGNLEVACETLKAGKIQNVDVGVIDGAGTGGPRHFLVLAGTGYDARTAQTVNSGIRFLSGPAAYVWGAVLTLWRFTPFTLTLTLDDSPPRKLPAMFVSFANAETTGGGMKIAPGARVDDGCLDICLVAKVSKPTLLYNLTQIFSGRHLRCAAVSMHRVKKLTVDADPPQPLLIDGEVAGTTPATVTLLPGALPFLVPAP